MARDGIEWPAKDLGFKRKVLLIWQVVKSCVLNTVKTNDFLAIYEILIDGYERRMAVLDEDELTERLRERK